MDPMLHLVERSCVIIDPTLGSTPGVDGHAHVCGGGDMDGVGRLRMYNRVKREEE